MIRFGIVGGGGIAKKFARDIYYVKEAIITAVASTNEKRAYDYQKHYQVDNVFFSYEDMAKSNVIDAVYIALPHNLHKEVATLFMKNHKHVLVEKPISVNENELIEMIRLAKDNNVLLMEAMWTAFLPATTYVKKIFDNHDLGNLVEAKLSFGYKLDPQYSSEGRLLNHKLAGGSLLDLGIYPISFYNLIRQNPIESINSHADFGTTNVDLETTIKIEETAKASITIVSSFKKNLDNDALFVLEKGVVKMIDFHRCKKIFVNEYEIDLPFEGEGFVHEIRSFVDNIVKHQNENEIINYDHNLEVMRLMDKIRDQINLKYPFE